MLNVPMRALTVLISASFVVVGCDDGSKKSSKEKDPHADEDLVCPPTGTAGTAQAANGQTQPVQQGASTTQFSLAVGPVYAKLKADCAGCHDGKGTEGTDPSSNYNDPVFVTESGEEILERVSLDPDASDFMPQGESSKVDYLAELQAWQNAGFPDIYLFEPTLVDTTTGSDIDTSIPNTDASATGAIPTNTVNQSYECQPSAATNVGGTMTTTPADANANATNTGTAQTYY